MRSLLPSVSLLTVVFLGVSPWPAFAQSTTPAAAPSRSAEESVSERVRREASNPLRIILEASKIRRRPVEAEPEAPAAGANRPAAARPAAPVAATANAAVRAAAASEPRALTAQAAPPAPAPTSTPTPTPAAAPAPVAPAALAGSARPAVNADGGTAASASPPALNEVVPSAEVPTPGRDAVATPVQAAATPAPALATVATPAASAGPQATPAGGSNAAAPATAATPAVSSGAGAAQARPAQQAATAAAQSPVPRLINTVMPDIPAAAMRRAGMPSELAVQVTIERDGSVSQASVLGTSARAIEPFVVDALKQWRYAPLPSPVTQRLQLVFAN